MTYRRECSKLPALAALDQACKAPEAREGYFESYYVVFYLQIHAEDC